MPEPILTEYANGDKKWSLNGRWHREDGPAMEYSNGTKQWLLNGKYHREDGPAIEYPDGSKTWWLNNEQYTEEVYVMIQFMKGVNIYV